MAPATICWFVMYLGRISISNGFHRLSGARFNIEAASGYELERGFLHRKTGLAPLADVVETVLRSLCLGERPCYALLWRVV